MLRFDPNIADIHGAMILTADCDERHVCFLVDKTLVRAVFGHGSDAPAIVLAIGHRKTIEAACVIALGEETSFVVEVRAGHLLAAAANRQTDDAAS